MNGELAQLVVLVSHASAFLAGDRGALGDVGPGSQMFRWVGDAGFFAPDGRVDGGPAGWVEGLAERGIDRVRLVVPSPGRQAAGDLSVDDRLLAGFTNAGRQWALATGSGRPEAWGAGWELGDRDREDQRIWSVRYEGQYLDATPELPVRSVADAAHALDAALVAIGEFALAQQHMGNWPEIFAAARVAEVDGGPTLLARSAPGDAQRLATRASSAWVFGGMGSWNDMGFAEPDAQARYDAVSGELYRCVLEAIEAAANATPPTPG